MWRSREGRLVMLLQSIIDRESACLVGPDRIYEGREKKREA